jgi:hypothetical protein
VRLNYKTIRLHSVNFIAKKATMFAFEDDIMPVVSKNKLVIPFRCCYKNATFCIAKNIFAIPGFYMQVYFFKLFKFNNG